MINLIYKSFPFGKAESFVEYEIPYLNEIAGGQYRIFSFYNGKDLKNYRKKDLLGKVYIVKISMLDYIKGAVSFFIPKVRKEFGYMKNRVSRDRFWKCVWRMLYYRSYGYAFKRILHNVVLSDEEVFISYWLNECAYAAVMLKQHNEKYRVFSRAHGFDVYEERCYLPYRAELFENIDGVLPINKIEKEYILDRYNGNIPEKKIQVSHLGINLPLYYSIDDTRKNFIIVTCSSIIQLKRLDLMIEALSEIKEFSYKWIHIGGGEIQDYIFELAKDKLNHDNQNYEFIGQISLQQVHELYSNKEVSLFVNCSDTEGVPVSIMEAMSYGIPTVARNVGGNSEIVDGYNGILLGANCSADELADAIRSVYYLNNQEYINMRRAARVKVENEFNADYQYRSFFKEVIEQTVR